MPQSYASLNVHMIFSTKGRLPQITTDLQPRLYEYIGGLLRERNSVLLAAGGVADHVHLLASLSREVAVAPLLRDIKSISSGWVHDTFQTEFAW